MRLVILARIRPAKRRCSLADCDTRLYYAKLRTKAPKQIMFFDSCTIDQVPLKPKIFFLSAEINSAEPPV